MTWASHLPVQRVRIVRPTNQFEELVHFYRDIIGLHELGGFDNHEGYSGRMLGLPDASYHMEIVMHDEGLEPPQPTKEDILVFYIDDQEAIEALVKRLAEHGYAPVEPDNPYWAIGGVYFLDPDGWGIIFMNMQERQRLLNMQEDL